MKQFIIPFSFCTLVLLSCSSDRNTEKETTKSVAETEQKASHNEMINIEIETFQNDTSGWGYDILIEGKKYVHQPHIPAISGNKGFSTQHEAEKVAELVKYKIKNNIMPPSVSPEELDSLGIEYSK
jgi:hypothetical protein